MILDLLNENLPWRNCKEDKNEIQKMKEKCLSDPIHNLFLTTTKDKIEIYNIFNHIKTLKYDSKPDYQYIYGQIFNLKQKEINLIYRNYEYNCQLSNVELNNNMQNCFNLNNNFLQKKISRNLNNSDNFYSNIINNNNNNNIMIQNPTQNQIVIINQYPPLIEKKLFELLDKYIKNQELYNNNLYNNENKNDFFSSKNPNLFYNNNINFNNIYNNRINNNNNDNNNINNAFSSKYNLNNDKSLIDSIINNLKPENKQNNIEKKKTKKKKTSKMKEIDKKIKSISFKEKNKKNKILFHIQKFE
jgi:hypothetical protein